MKFFTKITRIVALLLFVVGLSLGISALADSTTNQSSAADIAQAARTATATAEIANGAVVKITITDGGKGYDFAPKVTFTTGEGGGVDAEVTQWQRGSVENIVIHDGGIGYSTAPQVEIEPPNPIRAVAMERAAKERAELVVKLAAQKVADEKAAKENAELQKIAAAHEKSKQSMITNVKYILLAIAIIGAVIGFLYISKKYPSFYSMEISSSKKAVYAIVFCVAVGFGGYSCKVLRSESPNYKTRDHLSGGGSSSGSKSVSMSDVTGNWENRSDMIEMSLRSSGTCTFSYGHNNDSRGSWHLSGNTVYVNPGDGGGSLSFVYKNGKLVAPNGHYLTHN